MTLDLRRSLLTQLSLPRILLNSLLTTARYLPVILGLIFVFSLPIDIAFDWLSASVDRADYQDALRELLASLVFLAYTCVSQVGYVALAFEVREIVEGETPSLPKALEKLVGSTLVLLFATTLYAGWKVLWPLVSLIVCCVTWGIYFDIDRDVFFVTYVGGIVLLLPLTVWRGLSVSFMLFTTLFEGHQFGAAASRSKFLVDGRRWWTLWAIAAEVVLLVLANIILIVLLPSWLGWPEPDPHTLVGFARSVYNGFVSALTLSVGVIAHTLIYFRLRKDKHDLTFFELIETGTLIPASVAARGE